MSAHVRDQAPAFRLLERTLTRRRLMQLDPRMRGELALLSLLIAAFLFWQVRVPLDGLVRARGPLAGVAVVAIAWVTLAGLAGVLAGMRHVRRLEAGPAGPEWLALPCEHVALERHLAWESRSRAWWLAVPAMGVLVAGTGLMPAWWLAILAVAFAFLLHAAATRGCAIGYRAARSTPPRAGLHHIVQLLSEAAPRLTRRRLPAPDWRPAPAWVALAAKDLRITLRLGSALRSVSLPFLLGGASLLAWQIPGEPGLRHVVAFALILLAAASLAEWLAMLSGSDPFAVLRILPVGVATVWGARFAWGAVGTALLVAGQAIAARELAPHAWHLFLVWSAAATLAIATLGVNYGVTLFPRADLAQRLLGLALGLAVAASVMLPLSGWVVLLAAVLHSARRLPHWSRLEEA